jgi:hypothetical protein
MIFQGFPEFIAEFRGSQFSLLWRGGRDGLGGRDIHRPCDAYPKTVTLILDK